MSASARAAIAFASCAIVACSGCGANPASADADDASVDVGATTDAPTVGSDAPTDVADGMPGEASSDASTTSGRGFPAGSSTWLSYYGNAANAGDLSAIAAKFRVVDLDADPDVGAFTRAQIETLRAGGQNRVISYFNLGSCESFRSYWGAAPGFVPCGQNAKADLGPYDGYPDEHWMNPADPDYRALLVDYVAPRLVAQGIDGFFFDNLEVVEHGTATTNGPCDAACAQGGLDLVWALRQKYPSLLFVMQNATSDVTLAGTTHGVPYPTLLDGISHEEVFAPYDATVEAQLLAWKAKGLAPGGAPFWIATEDYVGSCSATSQAQAIYARSRADGFVPYVSDASAGQQVVCDWPF